MTAVIVVCAYVAYKGFDNYSLFAVEGYGMDEVEAALDDVEYLMDALDPELQGPAYQLVEALRHKLEQASG